MRKDNFYFCCYTKKFLFVYIPKNASTTLKTLCFVQDYPDHPIPKWMDTKFRFGGPRHIVEFPMAQEKMFRSFARFAVYRDPVERLLSLYQNKVNPITAPRANLNYLSKLGVKKRTLAEFLDVIERELQKPVLEQDPHIRSQCDFYRLSDVQHIVPIRKLPLFFNYEFSIAKLPHQNKTPQSVLSLSSDKLKKLQRLYKRDFQLLEAANLYVPPSPAPLKARPERPRHDLSL